MDAEAQDKALQFAGACGSTGWRWPIPTSPGAAGCGSRSGSAVASIRSRRPSRRPRRRAAPCSDRTVRRSGGARPGAASVSSGARSSIRQAGRPRRWRRACRAPPGSCAWHPGREPRGEDGGAATGPATSSATVTRQDLVARTEVDGTLGYARRGHVMNQAPGTVTALPDAGHGARAGPGALLGGQPARAPALRRASRLAPPGAGRRRPRQPPAGAEPGRAGPRHRVADAGRRQVHRRHHRRRQALAEGAGRGGDGRGRDGPGGVPPGRPPGLGGRGPGGRRRPPRRAHAVRDLDRPGGETRPRRHPPVAGEGGRQGRGRAAQRADDPWDHRRGGHGGPGQGRGDEQPPGGRGDRHP